MIRKRNESEEAKAERIAKAKATKAKNKALKMKEEELQEKKTLEATKVSLTRLDQEYVALLKKLKKEAYDADGWRRLDILQGSILNSLRTIRRLSGNES